MHAHRMNIGSTITAYGTDPFVAIDACHWSHCDWNIVDDMPYCTGCACSLSQLQRPNRYVCCDVSHLHRLGNKSSRQREQLSPAGTNPIDNRPREPIVATTVRFPSEKGYDNTDAHVGEHAHYETAGIAPIKNELRSKMQYATDGWLTTNAT